MTFLPLGFSSPFPLNANTDINDQFYEAFSMRPSFPSLSYSLFLWFFFISTGFLVYYRGLPFVDIPFEVWLLIRHKCATQRHLQHVWGAIQIMSAEKPAGQTVNFLTAEWVMVYLGFRLQWGLTVLLCNIGSNFCGLIKSCVSLWKWL